MNEYEPVIGLEIHLQLATQSKAFCGCKNEFGTEPNSWVCPVCLGLPGVLPVLNRTAFIYGLKVALALQCSIAHDIKFDRKNYYYPDLPKNYQISQYDNPIGYSGFIEIITGNQKKKIRIKRVHLEEDAGKLIHDDSGVSLVDFNRAGVPLLEIVSEPDIFSPEEAYDYLTTLKSIFEYLEVSNCNMEEGSLRCDANLSIRPKGTPTLGVKTEIKNMNSFKNVKAALYYEIQRQNEAVRNNERIVQETRLWDADRQVTASMRSKEEAHDYRYFPEPDLVPFSIATHLIEEVKNSLPELPHAKSLRLQKEYQLSEYDASVLTSDKAVVRYFEKTVTLYPHNAKAIANWITQDIQAYMNEHGLSIDVFYEKLGPEKLVGLIQLIDTKVISSKIAKEVFLDMIHTGLDARSIVQQKGLMQMSDRGELETIAKGLLAEHPTVVDDYCGGKEKAMIFLIGKCMAKTKGKANPQLVNELLKQLLEEIKKLRSNT